MSNLKDNSSQYIKEIQYGFESFEPGNNDCIESEKLNELINTMNSKKKNTFLYNLIRSITAQKIADNEDKISLEEYISFVDEQLNDTKSKEGVKKIFSLFCDPNKNNFSWTKFPLFAKELGDDEMANKLLKLLEQSKLYTKDLNFREFYDIIKDDYVYSKKIKKADVEDYEDIESYKQKKKKKYKKNEEEEEIRTTSSKNSYKNEENKKSGEDNDGEKSSKRYHRRYRDSKNKNENNENGNNINKTHVKYRKKH